MRETKLLCAVALVAVAMALAGTQPAAAVVNGDGLEVLVGAQTSVVGTYIWEIDKWADQSSLTVAYGDEVPVNYAVMVDICCVEEDYGVAGDFYVLNLGLDTVDIEAISAIVSPDIVASIDCGIMLPYALDAGQTLTCAYSAILPDDSSRTVTVGVTADGLGPYVGTADVDFSSAILTEVDTCVDVVDSWDGYLGSACVEGAPATFYYTRMIGGCVVCGYREVYNHAYFTTNDTDTTACDSWTVCVYTPCEGGCTRTFGYWKTHSEYGPAPYDDTWAELPDGADTMFFLSGQTYYEVLWTPPKKGNAYYILAHQWIAAQLNVLSGAAIPQDVLDAWLEARDLFEMYTPYDIGALKSLRVASTPRSRVMRAANSIDPRDRFIELAEILDAYNNGYVGPGHCVD